jgi:CheY-like chemotaxis protein
MSPTLSVLHVDDERSSLDLFTARAARLSPPVRVTSTTDPDAALDRLGDGRFDVVVSDALDTASGRPFFEAVRDRDADVPLVLYTAAEFDDVRDSLASVDGVMYVRKGGGDDFELVARRLYEATGTEPGTYEFVRGDDERDDDDAEADAPDRALGYTEQSLDESWEVVGSHDWDVDDDVATSIVLAIESHLGEDLSSAPPLGRTVEADALGRMLSNAHRGDGRDSVQIRFIYDRWEVAVTSDGTIAIRRPFR